MSGSSPEAGEFTAHNHMDRLCLHDRASRDGPSRAKLRARDLADQLSCDCQHNVASGWYRQLFPARLSPQRAAMPEFDTTAQGCRLATSVGGVLTGRGADLIIIDDPLKPEEALSQAQRQAANDWYDHTLYSRLNDKLTGAIVLIMHRLHESLSGTTRGTI